MRYRTLVELYLTFLTHNDSYMQKVPVGSELTLVKGDLCYKGNISIDNQVDLLHHKYIEEIMGD